MPPLTSNPAIRKVLAATRKRALPLWAGPNDAGPNGGITQGLLSKFIVCRERTRILLVEGLKHGERFSRVLFYGNCWHTCEEWYAKVCEDGNDGAIDVALSKLEEYAGEQLTKFPFDRPEIAKWHAVCRVQFPLYRQFWAKHTDVTNRTPLLQEHEFSVPYVLPSGRMVRLRGKWDSVDLVNTLRSSSDTGNNPSGVWLMENKSKGDIDEEQLKRELSSGLMLQPMFYLVALTEEQRRLDDSTVKVKLSYRAGEHRHFHPVRGVRWNVVRRPLSGGKGTIVQHSATKGSKCPKCKGVGDFSNAMLGKGSSYPCPKCRGTGRIGAKPAETDEAYYGRLAQYVKDAPETYFMRWNYEITAADLERFRKLCLDPLLETLCDWWWQVTGQWKKFTDVSMPRGYVTPLNYVTPFGVWSSLLDGGETELDQYIKSGSRAGLVRTDVLFPELGAEGGK